VWVSIVLGGQNSEKVCGHFFSSHYFQVGTGLPIDYNEAKEKRMKIKVLGCSGATFPNHHPPGFLLDDRILFDAGSLTDVLHERAQMKIKHIFITHAHLDHILGIPFLADNVLNGRKGHCVNVFSIPSVIRTLKRNLLNSSIWPDFTVIPHSERPVLSLNALRVHTPIRINEYRITPYKVNHSVPAVGYLVEDKRSRRFFYTGDTGPTESTWRKIGQQQIHALIIEVSLPNNMGEMAIKTGHLTSRLFQNELLKIKETPERIYITHPKPQYFKTIQAELQRLRLDNLTLLRDGETINV
jgi:ribonuclease BN (tRNA processing enzyme)